MKTLVNKNIAYLSRICGFRQVDMGNVMGVGRSTISNYEKKNTLPDAEAIANLCQYFGLSADHVLFLDLEAHKVQLDVNHRVKNLPELNAAKIANMVEEEVSRYKASTTDCEKQLMHTREILMAKIAHIASLEKLVEVLQKK